MKIKEQTRKLAAGCSKQCFEVVDRTDEVSNYIYGKVKLTWFEFDFRSINSRKTGQEPTPDLFLLQNDKNYKLFDKYACQKEKDVLQ